MKKIINIVTLPKLFFNPNIYCLELIDLKEQVQQFASNFQFASSKSKIVCASLDFCLQQQHSQTQTTYSVVFANASVDATVLYWMLSDISCKKSGTWSRIIK